MICFDIMSHAHSNLYLIIWRSKRFRHDTSRIPSLESQLHSCVARGVGMQVAALAIAVYKSVSVLVTVEISSFSKTRERPAKRHKISMTSTLLLLLIVTSAATVRASSESSDESASSKSASSEVFLCYELIRSNIRESGTTASLT